VWAKSFAKGAGGLEIVSGPELSPGPVAFFGSAEFWPMLDQIVAEGREWIYGDHAYFGRRRYFRATRNALQHDASGEANNVKRFESFGIKVERWRKGSHILLCPNSPGYFAAFGMEADEWVKNTTAELRQHTGRDIRVRWKNWTNDLQSDLKNAWACVVFTSVCGVHAALRGVPCFATAPCASRAFGSGNLALIEQPPRPDNRFEMACVLAENQWTMEEMSAGMAWEHLT
jgi:hypothetical protein